MNQDDFWTHIAVLEGICDARSIAALTDRLATLPADEIEQFAALLHERQVALDPNRFAMLAVHDVTDPPDSAPVPLLGDALFGFICAVVAAGRDVYAQTCADIDSVTRSRWDFSEAVLLTRAAPQAYEQVAGRLWDGSLWPDPDDVGDRPASGDNWCEVMVFNETGSQTGPYADAMDEIVLQLNASPAWRAWWAPAGLTTLAIVVEFDAGDSKPTLRRANSRAQVEAHLDKARLRGLTPGMSATRAAHELKAMLDFAGNRLQLGQLPAVLQATGAEPITMEADQRANRLAELRRKHSRR